MDINLELYKVFYTVAKLKSMTKAAKKLEVSQPAVTKSIKTLETQLGGTLFIRSNKGLELTEEGKNFYNKIEIAFSFINDAENSFGDFKDMKLGEVKIGISSVLTKILLLDIIKEYRDKYPGVKISITNGLTSDLINNLNKGKLDFVIYNEEDIEEKNVDIKKINTLSHNFVYNKNFFDLSKVSSIEELTSYPLIFQKKDSNTRKLLESYLKENNITLTPIVEVVNQDLICEFVNKGIGVGFVLEDLVDEKYKELEKVKIKENIKTDIYIATNKFINPTFAAEKFLTLIK
jgi:DNA-binding transcriptional LysR family regulator